MQNSESPFLFEAESPMAFGQVLSAVRRITPVFYDPVRKSWVMLRHRDIHAALRNPDVFSNRVFQRGPMGSTFSAMDGEAHARPRRMYSRAFSPRAIARYESEIVVPAAHKFVDRMRAQGSADLVRDFCIPVPIEIISRLLGLSPETVAPCHGLCDDIISWALALDDPGKIEKGRVAHKKLLACLLPEFEKQFRDPGDNLMGEMVRIQRTEGIEDHQELLQMGAGLLVAGFETTIWMLACALGTFLLYPEILNQVLNNPALLMPAVEESMRWANSSVGTLRQTTRDVEVSGVTIPEGSTVLLCTAAAHYDEEVYPDPEKFDIHRKPDHLLFIAGPHTCMGAAISRMEARAALPILFAGLPGLRLDPSAKLCFAVNVNGSAMHGPTALPVFFDAEQMAQAA